MARRREHLCAYLRIYVSGRQQNHKKIEKNQEKIIRYRLKKNFPAGSNVYLRICYFSKEITALVYNTVVLLCQFLDVAVNSSQNENIFLK